MPFNISDIKNKIKRSEIFQKQRLKKAAAHQERRKKRAREEEETGIIQPRQVSIYIKKRDLDRLGSHYLCIYDR